MAQTDLTTLARLKTWLDVPTADVTRDTVLSQLISQISRAIFNSINREPFPPRIITDRYSGNGQTKIQIDKWPVKSIVSLAINGVTIPQSTGWNISGYSLDDVEDSSPGNPQLLSLIGYCYPKGVNNIVVTYLCGYLVQSEIQTVSSSAPYTVTANSPYGMWSSDYLVLYAGGAALTQVSSTPSAGQYSVRDGVYTFSASDAGQQISLSYGYIPGDLSQAALEFAAYRFRSRDRIGQSSKSLGGQETVSYLNEAVPVFVESTLKNFRRII